MTQAPLLGPILMSQKLGVSASRFGFGSTFAFLHEVFYPSRTTSAVLIFASHCWEAKEYGIRGQNAQEWQPGRPCSPHHDPGRPAEGCGRPGSGQQGTTGWLPGLRLGPCYTSCGEADAGLGCACEATYKRSFVLRLITPVPVQESYNTP